MVQGKPLKGQDYKVDDMRFIKDRTGGIIPIVRVNGQTLILPRWQENGYVPQLQGPDAGVKRPLKGSGYDTIFNKGVGVDFKQVEKVGSEVRAQAWFRTEMGIRMTPLNFYNQQLPDGVNADFAQKGIHTLYNTGNDPAKTVANKISKLIQKNYVRDTPLSGRLRSQITYHWEKMKVNTVTYVAGNLLKEKYDVQQIDDTTLRIVDKSHPQRDSFQIRFSKGGW